MFSTVRYGRTFCGAEPSTGALFVVERPTLNVSCAATAVSSYVIVVPRLETVLALIPLALSCCFFAQCSLNNWCSLQGTSELRRMILTPQPALGVWNHLSMRTKDGASELYFSL
jgi:hypothetical protein